MGAAAGLEFSALACKDLLGIARFARYCIFKRGCFFSLVARFPGIPLQIPPSTHSHARKVRLCFPWILLLSQTRPSVRLFDNL